jgi:hypothetical protein
MGTQEEIAKAISQAAGVADKALNLVRDVGVWVGSLVEPAAAPLSEMFADQARYWRARNLNRIATNYSRLEAERPFHPDAKRLLPFGQAYRAFGIAAEEESPVLQEMWAKLLFNATRPDSATTIEKHFVDLLHQLSEIDALLLQAFYEWGKLSNDARYLWHTQELDGGQEKYIETFWNPVRVAGAQRATIALNDLLRLRLVAPAIGLPSSLHGLRLRRMGNMMEDEVSDTREAVREFSDEVIGTLRDIQQSSQGMIELKESTELPALWAEARIALDVYTLTPLGSDLIQACTIVN